MRSFSFVHCGDLHLGAPFRGLDAALPDVLRERLRAAPVEALGRIVNIAIENDVAAVLMAGDLFNGSERNLFAQVQLHDALKRLDNANIRSFIVAGNHDPLPSRASQLPLPPSAHVFGSKPEKVPLEVHGEIVAHIYGVSYTRASETGNLAERFPRQPKGPYAIGLLHTNLGGRPGHDRYAPCSVDSLKRTSFDYWALGHVHTRETVLISSPVIHYPGNPQGLHAREHGARGATLVEVSSSGEASLKPFWTDVVRWHRHRTNIEEFARIDGLFGAFTELAGSLRSEAADRTHLLHWTLTGSGSLHDELASHQRAELINALREAAGKPEAGGAVWLQRLNVSTQPVRDVSRLRKQQDYLGGMLRAAESLRDWKPGPRASEVRIDGGRRDGPKIHSEIRKSLGKLMDLPRLRRALGKDPWESLRWESVVRRAENLAIEKLAPEEKD